MEGIYRSYCVHLHSRASASKTVWRTSRSCFLALHLPCAHGAQEGEGEGHRGRVDVQRTAAAEDHAAAAADRATTEDALATREAKIIKDSESIRRSLDQHRKSLEARERALATGEAELTRREEQVA